MEPKEGLYQQPRRGATRRLGVLFVLTFLAFTLAACAAPQLQPGQVTVTVTADGQSYSVSLPAGSTVRDAIEATGTTIAALDRSEPTFYTVVTAGAEVRLIRVVEEFEVQESIIPYETQILRNESLPEGEQRLIQPGVNGLQEVTYRRVYEDGVEISNTPVKTVVVQEPVAEVLMVGTQAPFAALSIPGRLAYLSAGNAWIMEGSTGVRRPVVTTGDLDGRVFSLSPDGEWLLFTRSDPDEEVLNTLWVVRVDDEAGTEFDLGVENIVHYADWVPDTTTNQIAFSTVEVSLTAPGWTANNNLYFFNFDGGGGVSQPRTAIASSSGGVYGWWGMTFAWSPDGENLAYARADEVGLVDVDARTLTPLMEINPLRTGGDWAWTPGISWGADGNYLYVVDHPPLEGLDVAEDSPLFDLAVVPLVGGAPLSLETEVGMFAYPLASPMIELPSGEVTYYVAYLKALKPAQSETSGYRLMLMDRDGSNDSAIFPPEGAPGLMPDPRAMRWAPQPEEDGGFLFAVVYQGNLWLVNTDSGQTKQLTGDGSVSALDWK